MKWLQAALDDGDLRIALGYALNEVAINRRFSSLFGDGDVAGRQTIGDDAPPHRSWSGSPLGDANIIERRDVAPELARYERGVIGDELWLALRDDYLVGALDLASMTLLSYRRNQGRMQSFLDLLIDLDSQDIARDVRQEMRIIAYTRWRLGDDAPFNQDWENIPW